MRRLWTALLLSSALLGARGGSECSRLRWLHTPKTGSTFCLTLQHFCCPTVFERLANNVTLEQLAESVHPKTRSDAHVRFEHGCAILRVGDNSTCHVHGLHTPLAPHEDLHAHPVVGLFRDPKRRLISAFLDSYHHEGMTADDFSELLVKMKTVVATNKSAEDLEVQVAQAQLYAAGADSLGCQVKMLNGYDCHAPVFKNQPFNVSALDFALQRLRSFLFIGITDQYELSVRLFHATINHGTAPLPVEFFVGRATNSDYKDTLLQRVHFYDPYDSVLYAEARRIFEARVNLLDLQRSNILPDRHQIPASS